MVSSTRVNEMLVEQFISREVRCAQDAVFPDSYAKRGLIQHCTPSPKSMGPADVGQLLVAPG